MRALTSDPEPSTSTMHPPTTAAVSTSAPPPTEKRVPSLVLRMILEGIKDASGTRFNQVLEEAGLSRYAQKLPAPDPTPTLTEPDLSALYGATYRVIGESLTRLFFTRYGQKLPEAMIASPPGQQMMARMEGVPDAQRLEVAIRTIADTGTRLWTPMHVSEDEEAWYLEIESCAICARIRGARSPICANSEFFYGALARALTGFRLTALEIACAATGAPRCKYRIRK